MNIRRSIILTFAALLSAGGVWAEPIEYQVKAAFIYNFAKFVKWPAEGSKITLCVIGKTPLGSVVENIDGKLIGDRVFRVASVASMSAECNIVFISATEQARLASILQSFKGGDVLTVADTEGFSQKGVMINFFIDEEGKVKFEINIEAIKKSRLVISSQLLKLGKQISGSGGGQ